MSEFLVYNEVIDMNNNKSDMKDLLGWILTLIAAAITLLVIINIYESYICPILGV
jgi:hypothetical protein